MKEGITAGVLGLGLSAEQRELLENKGIVVVEPGWDYDVKEFTEPAPQFFKSMTARPHLPRHFPGYDVYMWIDADAWVQDWSAVQAYIQYAQKYGFVVTPECDRSYLPFYAATSVLEFSFKCFVECVDKPSAQQLAQFPLINSGVFAARQDAPHWGKWSTGLGEVLAVRKKHSFLIEQTVLNVVIRTGDVKTIFLSSRYNWMCNRAMPVLAADGVTLLDPQAPFEPLGIIHMTANMKYEQPRLLDQNGVPQTKSLRYPGPALF